MNEPRRRGTMPITMKENPTRWDVGSESNPWESYVVELSTNGKKLRYECQCRDFSCNRRPIELIKDGKCSFSWNKCKHAARVCEYITNSAILNLVKMYETK